MLTPSIRLAIVVPSESYLFFMGERDMRSTLILVCAATVASLSASSLAGVTTTNPNLYTNLNGQVQARLRVDQGNSQTWKTGFWSDATNTPIATGGNFTPATPVWTSGTAYDFTITYNSVSGAASIVVGANQAQNVNAIIPLNAGKFLAGFSFFLNSADGASEGSRTSSEVFDLTASTNGQPAQPIASLTSNLTPDNFVQGPTYYVDSPTTTISLSGKVRFAWEAGANLNNERVKFTLKFLEGDVVPTPGSMGLLALAGLVISRRRR